MRELGPSSENEMVLAFLRAEVDSPRFGQIFSQALAGRLDLVRQPRTDDPGDNAVRKHALALVRGYGVNTLLFQGFPTDVTWVRMSCTRHELGEMKYANHQTWTTLSRGTRLVRDGAANVETTPTAEEVNTHIRAVAARVERGEVFPELIVATEDERATPILIEGHSRATAYVLALPDDAELEVIAARGPGLSHWAFY